MSHIDVRRGHVERAKARPTIDTLAILSCLPVVLISAAVLLIEGTVNLGFLIPAIVCGAMIGMLMFVTLRDGTRV